MLPNLIKGDFYTDLRGRLTFNNTFNSIDVKRIYTIENNDLNFIRAWQGHKIEQRWFSAMSGKFEIKCIPIDDWDSPSRSLQVYTFVLDDKKLNVLHLPGGCVSSIQALEENSKLLVMADYLLGEINDEYRFEANYFNK